MTSFSIPTEQSIINTLHKLQADTSATQDRVDILAAEFFITNVLRKYADKRYRTVNDTIRAAFGGIVTELQETAKKNKLKSSYAMSGKLMSLEIIAASPAMRIDPQAIINHLVKAGVDRTIIDAAVVAATTANAPAISMHALTLNGDT